MKIPSSIFRYQPISTRTLQNLLGRILYFTAPINFNDPLDCAVGGRIKETTEKDLERIRQHFLRRKDISKEAKDEFRRVPLEVLEDSMLRNCKAILTEERDKFRISGGVVCFSESKDNTLMWSHYADNGKGICLEFATDEDPFDKILKVRYKRDLPELILHRSLSKSGPSKEILKLFLTKSIHWKYEKEWRLLHNEGGTIYSYRPDSLKAVYFGPMVEIPKMMLVCSTIKAAYQNVRLFGGLINPKEFKVDFEEMGYVTPNEALKRINDNKAVGGIPARSASSLPPL